MTEMYAERRDQMFPKLTQAQIARISGVGERRKVRSGEVLFELGEQNTRFFVVIEGAIEIVRPVDGREERITVLGPGEFTGEINMLSARRNLVRARALDVGSIVVVDREHVRALVQRDFELSEILMRAFILRRVALIAQGGSGLVLIGSRHSRRTLEIREFLSRNGQPFTYHELESEPDVPPGRPRSSALRWPSPAAPSASTARRSPTRYGSRPARPCEREPWSSPVARGTGNRPWRSSRASRAPGSCTARPTSRRSSAKERRSPSSEAETLPDRRRFVSRRARPKFTCWYDALGSRTACRATSFSESKTARASCCERARRSTRSRGPAASSGSDGASSTPDGRRRGRSATCS